VSEGGSEMLWMHLGYKGMMGKNVIFHCSDINQALYDSFMTLSSVKVLCVFHGSAISAFSLSMTENKLK